MNSANVKASDAESRQTSLRLLPGVIIVALQWLIRFVIPSLFPDDRTLQIGVLGGILGGVALLVWWAFFSRAPNCVSFLRR